tara:strand:+ start:196 stop:921 length:726 start_codon:yes stop_codon:yes gene_type:complete
MLNIQKYNKIIAANWKLNGSRALIQQYIENAKFEEISSKYCAIVCPPAPYLKLLANQRFFLGAQNCSEFNNGAYTGEISAEILKDNNCDFCIVGHSERRILFNESNKIVRKKINNCIDSEIIPILCIGETLIQKNNNLTKDILSQQISESIPSNANHNNLIIAYEPIWAIGTGVSASINVINEIHKYIQNDILNSKEYKIIYGGSVNLANIKDIFSINEVHGVLVGGTSLNIQDFNQILSS